MTTSVDLGCYVFGIVDAGARLPTPLDIPLAAGLRLVEHDAVAAVVSTPPADRPLGRASDLLDHDRLLVDLGCYVFGIVNADARLPTPLDIPLAAGLRLVEHGAVAAVASTPPADRPLGRASDLLDHDRLLADLIATGTAVLPMRFGTVMPDDEAVTVELLAPRHDDLRERLDEVRGKVQYTVKARYEEDAVLREVLTERPDIAALRGDQAGFQQQLQLGERVVAALEELRTADAPALLDELGQGSDRIEHAPATPDDVLHVAYLIEEEQSHGFEQRVEEAARRRAGRIRIRLMGPSPAYDFVGDN